MACMYMWYMYIEMYDFLHTFTARIHACMAEASAVTKKSSAQQNVNIYAGSENTTESSNPSG